MLPVIAMNSELNRMAASQQYFELRIALNRANRIKNLKTELEFEIRENEEEYFVIIKSTAAEHGFRIATYKKEKNEWTLFDNENYADFFKYMYEKIFLLTPSSADNFSTDLASWLSRLWII